MNGLFKISIITIFVITIFAGCKEEPEPEIVTGEPVAENDSNTENTPDETVTVSILANDLLSDESIAIPEKVTVDLNPATTGNIENEIKIEDVGTWVYNGGSGILTFYPVSGHMVNPETLTYKLIEESTGSTSSATVTVTYNLAPFLTQKVNNFLKDVMEDVYLWYKELPNIDTRGEFDSEDYFDKLLYEEDRWSFVTDDLEALEGSLQGEEKTFGYSLAFGRFSNTGNLFAIIEFIYPNTPAENAGLKRGDIIIAMNNADITDENYEELLYADNIRITLGVITETGIGRGRGVNLTSEDLQLDPVVIKKVVEENGHKIGYLFYAQFIGDFNASLDDAFQYFIDEQVTDLVIDLRYNPGGYTSAAQRLCSSVAPLSVVNSNSTLVTFQWNDKYQEYWEQQNVESQLKISFESSAPVKMGLDKIYILTGRGSASASELTITGLGPYMDVVTVGDTTYGKYTASITLSPEEVYDNAGYYRDFKNWAVQPIVIRYANSLGVTDFKDGFAPVILVFEDIFAGIPLGDKSDPLFKAVIEDITGMEVVALKKATRKIPPYKIIDRGFSRFDRNKRELIFDGVQKDKLLNKNNL